MSPELAHSLLACVDRLETLDALPRVLSVVGQVAAMVWAAGPAQTARRAEARQALDTCPECGESEPYRFGDWDYSGRLTIDTGCISMDLECGRCGHERLALYDLRGVR